MPILNEIRLPWGPYAFFVDLARPLDFAERGWPRLVDFKQDVFFQFSDVLCDYVCSVTGHYLPFNQYDVTQMTEAQEILSFSREWLTRANLVANSSGADFISGCQFRDIPSYLDLDSDAASAAFQRDLLDTFLFLSQRLHDMAFTGRTLTIVGY